MPSKTITVDDFVKKTLALLELERQTEIEETRCLTEKLPAKELQRRGVCLLKLYIVKRKTGLYGRTVVTLETKHESLPSHSITPGDITGLSLSHGDSQPEELSSGIVTKVSQSAISVAFDDKQDIFDLDDEAAYKLTKLANDVTYKRLKKTLEELDKTAGSGTRLVPILFGDQELAPPNELRDLAFVNLNLDESQREAVTFALSQKDVAVVHGPPGTGKTTTVIEIILQSVRQGNKVLACAPSNIAVDNLVERLAVSKHRIVRIGHPARLLPHIQRYSLDAILSTSDETRLVEDVRKDLDNTLASLKKARHHGEKHKLRQDLKHLRKELKTRAEAATRDILKRADVVMVTLTSATDSGPIRLLNENHFDMVVIDECSQALEAACWIPLLRSNKCVLAGDHLQLPPTILSKQAAAGGLELTLMERVLDLHGDKVMRMLTTQYRMNKKIMQWSSDQLYHSRLVAHSSVSAHLLRDLQGVEDMEETETPLLFIDTAGCDLTELNLPEEISKGNEGEADVVAAHVQLLIKSGVKQEDIGVITPYNLQVELVRLRLAAQQYTKVEVKSVDGFQGREKEAIVISLVRSNPKREVGFLSERRRINVAVTRARRHLAVIGDSETVGTNDFLKSLVDYLSKEGEVQTAQLYIQEGKVNASKVARPEHLDDLISLADGGSAKGARPKSSKPQTKKPAKKDGAKKDTTNNRPVHSGQRSADHKEKPVGKQEEGEEEEVSERAKELQEMLDNFVSDGQSDRLVFPASYTAHDRFIIHDLSEKMGMAHISKGQDEGRYIVVSKPGGPPQRYIEDNTQSQPMSHDAKPTNQRKKKKEKNQQKLEKSSADDIKQDTEPKEICESSNLESKEENVDSLEESVRAPSAGDKVSCHHCGKDVIKANIQLHELNCLRTLRGRNINSAGPKMDKPSVSQSTKHRQLDKELAKKMSKVADDDFDALIETVQKSDKYCCFKKCKKSVQTLFNQCAFCQGRYCLEHNLPEIHGCGDAAKSQARAQIIRDGVLYRGSGVPNRKPDKAKKAQIQRKFDHKLSELAEKRKGKPKK